MMRALKTSLQKNVFLNAMVLILTCVGFYYLSGEVTGFLHKMTFYQGPNNPFVAEPPITDSTNNHSVNLELLITTIITKLEYTPRVVPEEKEVMDLDPNLFSMIPREFLPHVKSPCWYEEFSGDPSVNPYKGNPYVTSYPSTRATYHKLWENFTQHLHSEEDKKYRMRCLPYLYIIGQPKCGTTDLFSRLSKHPALKFNVYKESHWWARLRFGFVNFRTRCPKRPVRHYLDLFDLASHKIQESIKVNSSLDQQALKITTADGSTCVMSENKGWSFVYKDWKDSEPKVLALDFIYRTNPSAKIIAILRDPVDRLYSEYLYFDYGKKTAENFHDAVIKSLEMYQSCLAEKSLRYCVYNSTLIKETPTKLHEGMYVIYLLDWLSVYSREQILVLQTEHYSANIKEEMDKVFDFLDLDPLPEQLLTMMVQKSKSNTRRKKDRTVGEMLPATRLLLKMFYYPFNQKLASVLNNRAFLWSEI